MKRRIFNILAAVSLVLCLATAGLWVRSYWPCGVESGGSFSWLLEDGVLVFARLPAWWGDWPAVPHRGFLGLAYLCDRSVGLFLLTVPLWFLCTLTAILPALWLWRYRRDRRLRSDGMPHCAKCDYNLTGNVSGICPECGTPIPADLVRRPIT